MGTPTAPKEQRKKRNRYRTDADGWPKIGCPRKLPERCWSGSRNSQKQLTRPQAQHLTTLVRLVLRDGLPIRQAVLDTATSDIMAGLVAKRMVETDVVGDVVVLHAFTSAGLAQVMGAADEGSRAYLDISQAMWEAS
ncbi:MAG: hypothetical protein GY824_09915 [Delftia sp.]|nr:hypothetical protein [Delftia sp.]